MKKNSINNFLGLLVFLSCLPAVSAQDNVRLGNDDFNKGNFTEAVGYYESALIDKKSSDIYINLGHSLSRLGRWDKAVQAYKSAIETQKESPSAELLRFLGQAEYMAGYFDEALGSFQNAYVTAPDSEDELWLDDVLYS